jgi:hypothetical protein
MGLFDSRLCDPVATKSKHVWPAANRRTWLDVLEASTDLIYKDGSTVQTPEADGAPIIEPAAS